MLHFEIDNNRGQPAYRQLMEQVKYYVASGAFAIGDQLPSIRGMAKYLSVNPTTVVKAYSELEHEKVIVRKQGKGVFVAVTPKKKSKMEMQQALQDLVRHVVVEATQMGATEKDVLAAIKSLFKELK